MLQPYDTEEMHGKGIFSNFLRKDPYGPTILKRTGQIAEPV